MSNRRASASARSEGVVRLPGLWLAAVILLALLCRLPNLGGPDFDVDEVLHVIAAEKLMQGEEPDLPDGLDDDDDPDLPEGLGDDDEPDLPDGLDEPDCILVVLGNARGDREDVRVEDYVLGWEPLVFHEDAVHLDVVV